MKINKNIIFCFSYFFIIFFSIAQTKDSTQTNIDTKDSIKTKSKYVSFYGEEDPFKKFEGEPEKKEFKKKKPKRRVYYKFKTRRGFSKNGYGRNETREVYHYLKVFQKPSIYAKDIHWFHTEKMKIVKTAPHKVDPAVARILHGPYKKLINGKVVEKGIYYIGTKHARWEEYKKPKESTYKDTIKIEQQILVKKTKYFKGFPKDSEITYYDEDKTKIKEVIPYTHGEKHGEYFYFFENGLRKTYGKYMHNQKVGIWTNYYKTETKSLKHKQIKHPKTPFVEQFEPYLLKEWDRHRHLIYDKDQGGKIDPKKYKR